MAKSINARANKMLKKAKENNKLASAKMALKKSKEALERASN